MKNMNYAMKTMVILLALVFWSQISSAQNLIVNGNFTGGWSSWGKIHEGESQQLVVTGAHSGSTTVPAPSLGGNTFAFFGDQEGPSRNILYQTFTAPSSGLLVEFDLYINNTAGYFVTRADLTYAGDDNQHTRVDIITNGADIYSVSSGDVISMVYRTEVGYSAVYGWTRVSVNIPSSVMQSYFGSQVRLRIAQVDNCGPFGVGVTNVLVQTTAPSNPTSVSASANPICWGSSTQLTANGAVGTVYWYTGSCGGTQVGTGNPFTVSPTTNTTYYARNYNNGAFSSGCASLTVNVEQPAVAGTLTKTPNVTNVCEGTNVSAVLSGASGGNGSDEIQYRENNGSGWSSWTTYLAGSNISTSGKTQVEIRTRRLASYCSNSGYNTVSWMVEKTPVAGSLAKTPNVANVCEGTSVSAALTAGLGGNGTDETEYRTYAGGWSGWTTYVSGTTIPTAGKTSVEIRSRRMAVYCSASSYVAVSWNVEVTPEAGTLSKTPGVSNVCEGTNVSSLLSGATGGNGNNETQFRTHNGIGWDSWSTYISGTNIATTGKTQVEIQTRRLADYCSSTSFINVSWIVEKTPATGSLAKNPNVSNICEGTSVAASLTPGSGGNGNDVLQYRTQDGSGWSGWNTYTSVQSLSTTGLSGVEIRTWREADYCNDASGVTVSWIVDPTTVGGAVSGGALVCYGSHSTLLSLSGHTGSVVKWQFSTDGTNWTDIANTANTYTAENLVADTWFRAVVKSGVCNEENSGATQITMFTDYHVSGYAKYYNNPKTPLDGLKITLKKGGIQQGTPVTTGTNGWFDFGGLTNGTYDIEISSAHSTGQWQTWNGCNNTDYLLVSRHAAGVAPLATEPPVVRVSGDVIDPQTPPFINTLDANAVRNAARYGWFKPNTTTPWFDIPKWVFSGTSSGAPMVSFELNCSNVTRNIYGLCAGDVNGSYIPPSGIKHAVASVDLITKGTLPVTTEMTFPVRAERDMEIGAITLMLNFDPQLIEITGVSMADDRGEAPYFLVNGNQLHIGWMSLNPLRVTEGQTLLLIHTRLLAPGSHPGFTLDPNPISELADGEGNVLYGAKLSVADAGTSNSPAEAAEITIYPNPVKDVLFIEGQFGTAETISVELDDLKGRRMVQSSFTTGNDGFRKLSLDVSAIEGGVYLLKITSDSRQVVKKVMIRR